MISNVTEYIDFFRQLAVKHSSLLHNVASESGDGPAGSQHFTRISTEEVLAALNSSIGFPCLTLELYEIDKFREEVWLPPVANAAFMVVDNPTDASFAAQVACYQKCEQIVTDILRRIFELQKDESCDRPFHRIDADDISIIPVGPAFSGQYGYRVEFSFILNIDISKPPTSGTFIT